MAKHVTAKRVVFCAVILLLILVPLTLAALSPLLSAREPVYIIGGLAGVLGLCLLLLQPLLAAGFFPGTLLAKQRSWHAFTGGLLIVSVLAHIAGLYLTSPPDMIDALLLVSPTPYSLYGVIALWGIVVLGVVTLPVVRHRLKPARWRLVHNMVGALVVGTTVTHAVMIDGTMDRRSKLVLCAAAVIATLCATLWLRWIRHRRPVL